MRCWLCTCGGNHANKISQMHNLLNYFKKKIFLVTYFLGNLENISHKWNAASVFLKKQFFLKKDKLYTEVNMIFCWRFGPESLIRTPVRDSSPKRHLKKSYSLRCTIYLFSKTIVSWKYFIDMGRRACLQILFIIIRLSGNKILWSGKEIMVVVTWV